jgi:hypothetical protein
LVQGYASALCVDLDFAVLSLVAVQMDDKGVVTRFRTFGRSGGSIAKAMRKISYASRLRLFSRRSGFGVCESFWAVIAPDLCKRRPKPYMT